MEHGSVANMVRDLVDVYEVYSMIHKCFQEIWLKRIKWTIKDKEDVISTAVIIIEGFWNSLGTGHPL